MKHVKLRKGNLKDSGLVEFAKEIGGPQKHMVEIGSFAGEFAVMMAPYFQQIYCVDPWEFNSVEETREGATQDMLDIFDGVTGRQVSRWFDENTQGIHNISKKVLYDHEYLLVWNNEGIDVIYIDSIHTFDAVAATFVRWWPKLKVGGYMCGHDCSSAYPGVRQMLKSMNLILGQNAKVYEDTSWAYQKTR